MNDDGELFGVKEKESIRVNGSKNCVIRMKKDQLASKKGKRAFKG